MPMATDSQQWNPFRPTPADLARIAEDVAEIPAIQQKTRATNANLQMPDRVAHQYQIAGSKVIFRVANALPEPFQGVGLFQPGSEYIGIGRISTGLGIPHSESLPDFLGIMAAFQTTDGRRVDFLGINDSASPADNHREFMDILHATGESAGAKVPFLDQPFLAQQTVFGAALVRRMGLIKAVGALTHLTRQTTPTAHSSTAYQRYWTGVVEVGGSGGKFTFVPVVDENRFAGLRPGQRHLTEDWKTRQGAGDIEFHLLWIPFLDEARTPTQMLTNSWEENDKQLVGMIVFPQADPDAEESKLWAMLASEMGANPGNWIADAEGRIQEPATEFAVARKIAYQKSQQGRNALPPSSYQSVFQGAPIGPQLAEELRRRRQQKVSAGHEDQAP
jgi:hypothetical protein